MTRDGKRYSDLFTHRKGKSHGLRLNAPIRWLYFSLIAINAVDGSNISCYT